MDYKKKEDISEIELTTTEMKEERNSKDVQSPDLFEHSIISRESSIVEKSPMPDSCKIGNLIYEKKYKEAIELGLKFLLKEPNDTGVLINLMDAYFKGKEAITPDFLAKSSYYAKQAILYGHNTGYAEERLAKNLDKEKRYHQSLQLYNLILETKGFHFSSQGCGNCINWNHRKEAILKKMDKAIDSEDDILFTSDEIVQIIQSIKDNDNKEKIQKERNDRITAEIEKALEDTDIERWEKLFTELHNNID